MSKYVGPSSLIALAFFATCAGTANAVELKWQAPAECPSGAAIAKDIERLAGPQEGRALIAQVTISNTPDHRWRVVIDLSGSAAGHRELTANTCSQLSRAAALIVALAANPEAALDLPTEDPLPSTNTPSDASIATGNKNQVLDGSGFPANSSTQPSKPIPKVLDGSGFQQTSTDDFRGSNSTNRSSRDATKLRFLAFAGVGFDKQSLPVATEFGRLGLRLRRGGLGGELSADVTAEQSTGFVEGPGARFRALGAQLLGSIEPFPLPFHAALCVGPRIDFLHVSGFGTADDYSTWVLRPSGVFGTHFEFELSNRFSVGLSSEMLVYERRPKFFVKNVQPLLYQPATLGFRLGLEVAVRF